MKPSGPASERKTQAVLISGFLGSGKTTLLRNLLAWKEDLSDTVIIMNEFGDVSIDGMLVDRDVEMVELVSGCVCCTLQLDLRNQIERLVEQFHPRWLILEATGLADTGALMNVFAEYTEKGVLATYRLAAVIDAQIWPIRHMLGPVFSRQLECADLILVNKIDTLDEEAVKNSMAEIALAFPRAVVERTSYCRIDMNRLWQVKPLKSSAGTAPHRHGAAYDSTAGWRSYSFLEERPMNEDRFNRFLENLEKDIFRMKGVVRFEERAMIINHVNGTSEWTESAAAEGTKLVFIGRAADMDRIARELKGCVTS
jgi:G3E family GTPase